MYITDDMSEELNQNDLKINPSKKLVSVCFGCGSQITDQYILRVAPDLEWHAKCLKCAECGLFLDESCTCFVRHGKTYCKHDYVRLFSKKCYKCKESFNKSDFVMRANNRIYHVECFRCCMCNISLAPGDEFALKEEGLLCKADNEIYEKTSAITNNQPPPPPPPPPLTTCQNITNLPASGVSLVSNNSNNSASLGNPTGLKHLTKCGNVDSYAPHDYEDSQNCISPHFSQLGPHQQQPPPPPILAPLTNTSHHQHHHHMSSSHIIGSHLSPLSAAPHHSQGANGHMTPLIGSNLHQHQPQQQPLGNGVSSSLNTSSSSSSTSSSSNGVAENAAPVGRSTGGHGHGHGHGHGRKDKTTRVRTVLNEKQLHTLRTCYGANPRPDALMKEQLVEMTGLSPRVIRVWFQNKRCKDKKKTILIKQMQEQQKNRQSIGNGIPMIATSPVRNDINNLGPGSQIEMQQSCTAYQQSSMQWAHINGYGDQNNPMAHHHNNHHGMHHPHSQSAYDQLMGFSGSDEEDCFDQMSDANGDDSVSSEEELNDSRIQQL